jgi:two-component system NtrC family response regulator
LFSYANDGTLFLDEIGEMPISMQAHLLRVLEEKSIRPVGSNKELPVNVRIIAATNKELGKLVEAGLFREDLYFRLNVLNLQIPPLRSRSEDLNLLVRHFIQTISANLGTKPPYIDESELVKLSQYHWPGNVRELKNVIERSLLLGTPPSECITGAKQNSPIVESIDCTSFLLTDIEKNHILKVLKVNGGNKSASARQLGVSRKTLERKVSLWGSEDPTL